MSLDKNLSNVWDYKHGQDLPPFLGDLLGKNDVCNRFQVFGMLLHNIMLDCGFMLENDLNIGLNQISICYSHGGCGNLKINMYCNAMGPFVSVNAYFYQLDDNSPIKNFNVQLKYSEAMSIDDFSQKPENKKNIFKSLSRFTNKFAEEFVYQALNEMRKYLDLPPLSGLLSVLPHLLQKICLYLDVKDITNASSSCITLNNVLQDNFFWKKLFIRDFKGKTDGGVDFQEKYKFHYLRQKERESSLRETEADSSIPNRPLPMPGMIDPMQIIPNNPGFPGMIGGEYDLRPSFPYGGPFGGNNPMARPGRNPGLRPRFDPFGPPRAGPGPFRPGRGGGMMDDFFDMDFQARGRGRGGRFSRGFPGSEFDDDGFM